MTEREELMLYHGIMIGMMAASSTDPPNWAKPWIAKVAESETTLTGIAQEIKDEIIAVAMKVRGGEN